VRPTLRRLVTGLPLAASAAVVASGALVAAPAFAATPDANTVPGVDASTAVDWSTVQTAQPGAKFAYVEATVNGKLNSNFYANWAGANKQGLATGAYAFGQPNASAANGAVQARFFYDNGGALSTAAPFSLPPALDLELDAKGSCWGLSLGQLRDWVTNFITTFKTLSGATPVIYTSSGFWNNCVATQTLGKYPLWVADPDAGTLGNPGFGGATTWKFRQYSLDTDNNTQFDLDEFNGTLAELQAFGKPRISGQDRYATGLAAALSFPTGVDTVFVASGTNYPDALAAGAAAGKHAGPVLLTLPNAIPATLKSALSYLKPAHIVVVGGTTAVSSAVQSALRSYSPSVTRVQGAERTATSAAIALANFSTGVANAYVAMDNDWPDALAGSALAASAKGSGPMLLVETGSISNAVKSALSKLRPQHITVLGGTAVVKQSVANALVGYTQTRSASSVSRIAGADRFATSAAIAKQLASASGPSGTIYAASGLTFPDALVGAPLAALSSSPVLLVAPSSLPASVRSEVTALKPSALAILGGTASVSASVQNALLNAM
jgi:putative cell wall-binding protein/GH25 family lysozyme M1 (1,4-beta-N-acetylmuramidase)